MMKTKLQIKQEIEMIGLIRIEKIKDKKGRGHFSSKRFEEEEEQKVEGEGGGEKKG